MLDFFQQLLIIRQPLNTHLLCDIFQLSFQSDCNLKRLQLQKFHSLQRHFLIF